MATSVFQITGASTATLQTYASTIEVYSTQAQTSATNAAASATSAANSAASTGTNATTAATKATEAATSATNALASENAANTSAVNAAASATTASGHASTASTQASNASSSATTASSQATAAAASATTASSEASAAATSETNAATSATNAATSETNASTSETNAASSATNASTSASNASTSATNAASSASAASTSETNAATSESNASTSATNAASSASTASTQATNAANSATAAATSATNASNSATSAATSASTAQTLSNSFNNIYLGALSSAPTQDPDGSALDEGDLYYDTTQGELKVYKSSGWAAAGSTVNGTSARFHYDITTTTNTLSGADANGNTLAYDAGYVDVFVNGVRMSTADVTTTSGNSIVFADNLVASDDVDIVAYGTFVITQLNADNLDSGTVPDARITGAYTGITNLTMSGDLTVDTSTLYVDSSNNKVGIGTTVPISQLSIVGANSGFEVNGDSGSSNARLLAYDRNASAYRQMDFNASAHIFQTSNTERARIDGSGNLLVGRTSSTSSTVGCELDAIGRAMFTRASGLSLLLNRTTDDGSIAEFRKDNSVVGSIGTLGSRMSIGTGDVGLFFNDQTDQIQPINTSTNAPRDAAIDLGATDRRFKNLYLSGGAGVGANPSSFNGGANNLVVGTGSGSEGISIYAGNSSNSAIFFADTDSTTTGQINYQHASNAFTFHTNGGSEKMRIDSSGNLLVGKTSSNIATVGAEFRANGIVSGTRSSDPSGYFNRTTSDGAVIEIRKDNTAVGSIDTQGSALIIKATSNNLQLLRDSTGSSRGLNFGIDHFKPFDSNDAQIDLGTSSGRFKNLYLSGGVYLGGTGSANYLDDYEEGTFTATLEGTTSNPSTPVTLSSARYTKIGRQVMVQGQFTNVNTTGAAGGVRVTGLPFTASTAFASGNVMTYVRFTLQTNSTNISPYVSGTQIAFYQSTNGAGWGEIAHSAGTGAYLSWTAIYDTNS